MIWHCENTILQLHQISLDQLTINVLRLCLTLGVGIAWPEYSWNYRFPQLTLLFTTRVFCFKINWLGPQTVLYSGLQC